MLHHKNCACVRKIISTQDEKRLTSNLHFSSDFGAEICLKLTRKLHVSIFNIHPEFFGDLFCK
jgi:hypothetical protein